MDDLRTTFPTLDDYLLLEIFLAENRDALNRREVNQPEKSLS
jgi:hypothetical protein